jgi:hypothetical protein
VTGVLTQLAWNIIVSDWPQAGLGDELFVQLGSSYFVIHPLSVILIVVPDALSIACKCCNTVSRSDHEFLSAGSPPEAVADVF